MYILNVQAALNAGSVASKTDSIFSYNSVCSLRGDILCIGDIITSFVSHDYHFQRVAPIQQIDYSHSSPMTCFVSFVCGVIVITNYEDHTSFSCDNYDGKMRG